MIGEVFEISIVVSMLVLVGYPSTLMIIDALRAPQRPPQRALSRRSGAVGMLDRPVNAENGYGSSRGCSPGCGAPRSRGVILNGLLYYQIWLPGVW